MRIDARVIFSGDLIRLDTYQNILKFLGKFLRWCINTWNSQNTMLRTKKRISWLLEMGIGLRFNEQDVSRPGSRIMGPFQGPKCNRSFPLTTGAPAVTRTRMNHVYLLYSFFSDRKFKAMGFVFSYSRRICILTKDCLQWTVFSKKENEGVYYYCNRVYRKIINFNR